MQLSLRRGLLCSFRPFCVFCVAGVVASASGLVGLAYANDRPASRRSPPRAQPRPTPRPVVPLELTALVGQLNAPHVRFSARRDTALRLCEGVIDYEAEHPGALTRSPELRRHYNLARRVLEEPLQRFSVGRLMRWPSWVMRVETSAETAHRAETRLWWMLAACRDAGTMAHLRFARTAPSRAVKSAIRRHLRDTIYPRLKWGARAAEAHLWRAWHDALTALASVEPQPFLHRGVERQYLRVLPVMYSDGSPDMSPAPEQRAAFAAQRVKAVARQLQLFKQLRDPFFWVMRYGRVSDPRALGVHGQEPSLLDQVEWEALWEDVNLAAEDLRCANPWATAGVVPLRVRAPFPIVVPPQLSDGEFANALQDALAVSPSVGGTD